MHALKVIYFVLSSASYIHKHINILFAVKRFSTYGIIGIAAGMFVFTCLCFKRNLFVHPLVFHNLYYETDLKYYKRMVVFQGWYHDYIG